jgi:hypothetical protein
MEEVEAERAAALGRSEHRQAERIAQRDFGTYIGAFLLSGARYCSTQRIVNIG